MLDGTSLTIEELVRVARDPGARVECDPAALERVVRCRERIDAIVARYVAALEAGADRPPHVYGVTTGFGEFKKAPVPAAALADVQRNLLLSHASGVGSGSNELDPSNYFPAEVVRATLLMRLNAFLRGHSGVRLELVDYLKEMLHAGVVPLVPTHGSMGSSGDLCPLSHLFCVLLGEGSFYLVREPGDLRAPEFEPTMLRPAADLADVVGEPPQLVPKEGLALSNGTTVSAALLALTVHDATRLAAVADVAAALTVEAICGRARAFDPKVHAARGQRGQIASASNVRALLTGSTLIDRADDVQDVYSVRCAPAVHGASRDALAYARDVAEREINAASDNPLFFPDDPERWDEAFAANRPDGPWDADAHSAGNFHGQPAALAADFLCIATAELGNISERRTQMLLDRHHNRNLPPNLVARGGVNSGYMLAQYMAASLVSENKVLCHPASVDSIPTSANIEDHVSMAATAARKLRTVVAHVHAVLAVELLAACQALEWRVWMARDPNVRPEWARDLNERFDGQAREADAFAAAAAADDATARVKERLGAGTGAAYEAVRALTSPLTADRMLAPEIGTVRRAIEDGSLLAAVETALGRSLRDASPAD